ncbi:MAG: hypothetical protein LIP77_07885 [Planctomycetes bacterium]|nr:hypothetical protein [Planctomycetota bacterium]
MTTERLTSRPTRMWSLSWVILIRLILYLVVIGFFVQYMYFGERGQFYQPGRAIQELVAVYLVSLAVLAVGAHSRRLDPFIAVTYVLDLVVLSRVILASGGFNSVFIPYYLPVLVMATAWLPRQYTAVFPSIATLGAAYIGVPHLMVALGEFNWLPRFFPQNLLYSLRYSHPHTIVSTMLILTVSFFVVSYLSGILSDWLFIEQRLNAEVLSSIREGMAVVAATGEMVMVNGEFLRLFPEAEKAATCDDLTGVIFPGLPELTLDRLVQDSRDDALIFTRDRDASGRPPMEIRVSTITLPGRKQVYGIILMVADLTLRRRMEAAERNLERYSAISTMAAGLAHEIRNPMASLRSAIQEIGESFPEGSQNRVLTDVVISESDRLDKVIGRFLDFSREGRLRMTTVKISVILSELMLMFTHDPKARHVELVLDIQDDPPVLCDPDRLKEVFLNLALNAVQALPPQGGRLDVVLASAHQGGVQGVEILFLDNGPGIAENHFPRLFEPFFSSKQTGTGMGLPLSRKQVALHGGELDASNRLGGGACFRVWLPLKPADTPRESKSGTIVIMSDWRRALLGE